MWESLLFFVCVAAYASPRSEAGAKLTQVERTTAEQARAQAVATRDLASASAVAERLADERARQVSALHAADARVQEAGRRLADAGRDEAAAEAALGRDKAAFAALLPAMLRLSQVPAAAVLVAPAVEGAAAGEAPGGEALQGLMITRGLAVTLNRQAEDFAARQAAARSAGERTAKLAADLARDRAAEAAEVAALDRDVARAEDQVTQAEAEGREAAMRVAQSAARAKTLREAIAAMDEAASRESARAARQAALADRERQPGAARAARARQAAVTRPPGEASAGAAGSQGPGGAGQFVAPVAGPVLRAFGAAGEDGPATGMTFGAAAGAFVSAPCGGRVAFAAPFRSYGQLVILECGGGYDVVLAGLGSIGVRPGHAVRPGEPVGRMLSAGKASLYVELRSKGKTVDPAPFLKAQL